MTEPQETAQTPADEAGTLAELIGQRRAKAAKLREMGQEPWPAGVGVTHKIADIAAQYEGKIEDGESSGDMVTVAGRVVTRRGHGKLVFLVVRECGVDIQFMVSKAAVGDETMALVDDLLDVGDWVRATGEIIRSKRGELSVRVDELAIISKALRPLPDKWHGLTDTDMRYRQRYVDLIVNDESRQVFVKRSKIINAIRSELIGQHFIEVETPLLHPIVGGATAKPFITHHNALDMELYLRIAPELYLKRLIVGGLDRVFELGRTFRNEGLSTRHNPEFTMVETYEAYADADRVMDMTEAIIQRCAEAANGHLTATQTGPDGTEHTIDLSGKWARRSMADLVSEVVGQPVSVDTDLDELLKIAEAHEVHVPKGAGAGKALFCLYDELVEHTLIAPTFVIDYPVEVSPLAHVHRDHPKLTERFELIIGGRELANGFSELADPDDQRERFEAQVAAKAAGDDEAMMMDHDYLRALEYGLPPTGGLGIGVDRLVMLLTGSASIRDVLFFPSLRPEAL